MTSSKHILAGWLIDGSGGSVQKNRVIRIDDNMVGKIFDASLPELKNTKITDFSDCTIIPGLIDSHLHLFMSATDDQDIRKFQLDAGFDEIRTVISKHIDQLMAFGVSAVRDGGDWKSHAVRYKTECTGERKRPICVKVAGKAWRNHGRYGRLIGRPPAKGFSLADAILREDENIDHVKIVNSGLNSLIEFGKETMPQFSLREMEDAVNAARGRGLKVMVHVNGKISVKLAVEAGCDSIEHGFFMGKDNLKAMADKNITWVPTAFTMKAYSQMLDQNSAESKVAKKKFRTSD